MNADYTAAKEDFLSGELSLAEISRKYGIKYSSLRYKAKKEKWENQSPEPDEDNRKERIMNLSDRLLDKIEQSINEIDRCIMKTKEKVKTVEYDYDLKKPVAETVEEKENIEIIDGMIDKMGLKQLVSTLKDIKDIQLSISEVTAGSDDDECGVIVLGQVDENTLETESEDVF